MQRPEWLSKIQVIGWDVDGTLYPPDRISWQMILEEQYKAVKRVTGWPPDKVKREFQKLYSQVNSHTQTLTALGVNGEQFFLDLWDRLPLEQYLYRDPDLVEGFARIKAKYRHFILSNSNRSDQVERKLRLLGLDPQDFEFKVSTVEVGATKPDARPFLTALDRFPGMKAEQVLYVGDRVKTDVLGAHRVGMKAGLVWGQSEAADICANSIYSMIELIGE